MIHYRKIEPHELNRELFSHFIRLQEVTECWRLEENQWIIREDPFVDDWTEEDYRQLLSQLRKTLAEGGLVWSAFSQGHLKGFVSVEAVFFGTEQKYLDLSNLHVSRDLRRHGIGTALFLKAKKWAAAQGADLLYLSAHSAVETQAFYRKMGCVEAKYRHQQHIDREPFDCQMECRL